MEGRKPVRRAIAKKRAGPLFSEDILFDLNPKPPSHQNTNQSSTHNTRRVPSVKDKKEKKRERWLLTRKTWKYMADAGRKLIPDGVQNRPEDIQKCERHFHNLCANEPRFILWRRKASYPGAMGATRNSKRRLKLLLSHSNKLSNVEDETEESRNADHIIDLLQNFLKLDEARKTTTLLGSKTVRPDQTSSPSAQRPGGTYRGHGSQSMTMSSRGPGFLPPLVQPAKGINALSEIDQLLERLRTLSRSSICRSIIPLECITPEILEDKALLKQIYNELKKQQLHRIIGKHSSISSNEQRSSLPHASSLSSLWHFKRDGSTKNPFWDKSLSQLHTGPKSPPLATTTSSSLLSSHEQVKRVPPSSLKLPTPLSTTLELHSTHIPVISIKKPSVEVVYISTGTQTSFIQLHEIERLAKDYKEMKREEAAALAFGPAGQPADDESDKNAITGHGHRRKSSIDNEDVSQSVSDTIKRYLRMARKKSAHDDNANRFKRVNYDRNLRNIRAKGEINPPGMDDGNTKATQTLDAWPLISLDFIRGNENTGILEEAHLDWKKSLDQRIQQKHEYEEKLRQQQSGTHSSTSSSAPTSPTNPTQSHGAPTASGILHSSTQFLSNLWHGTGHHPHGTGQDNVPGYHPSPTSNSNSTYSITSAGTTASGHNPKTDGSEAMQKSKSYSNVGQFVSKKIWKTRSKSQTRTSSPTKAEWTPRGNCTWTSDSGRQVTLTDSNLQNLTEVEAKILQRVAIEKINQLNIGVSVAAPSEAEGMNKGQKRRPLAKKKAMTTSFFDIGRKDDKAANVGVFGNSLENCVAYDQKRRSNLTAISDRGSRNSITSLFRGSSKVRSCESLPSGTFSLPHSDSNSISNVLGGSGSDYNDRGGLGESAAGNGMLSKTATMQISRSQSDVRRSSQEYDDLQLSNSIISPPPMISTDNQTEGHVPTFVQECIKHLEKHGLHSVGIFRVSTSKKRVRQLREEFDRSLCTSIDPETCPHDVATLLKEFLRDLPEPLLCRNLYKAFIKTQKIRNRRLQLEALSHLVQLLPIVHRDTLYVLLRFLAKVASCCDDVTSADGTVHMVGNKMDSNNLATVFAPNILRLSLPGEENNEQESMGDVINVIRTMIDHYEELFRVPAELMDEIYANMIDTFPEQLNYLCERRNVSENDENESGSSSTPLNSPPPMAVVKAVSDEVPRRASQQELERNPHEASHFGIPPVPAPKRIYTREDVMHGNTVSKGEPPEDGISGSRRRTSKSKYSDIDSVSQQQQRQLTATINSKSRTGYTSDISNTPTKSSANVEFHSIQPAAESTPMSVGARRLSSPYILERTGVVTASLKIPVQMQAVGSGGGANDDELLYRGSGQFDLSNIPYIEDSGYGNECGNLIEGFPITGSLSFGSASSSGGTPVSNMSSRQICDGETVYPRKMSSTSQKGATVYQIPITYDGKQISPQPEASVGSEASSEKLRSFLNTKPSAARSARKTEKNNTMTSSNSQQKSMTTTTTKTMQLRSKASASTDADGHQIEPKLPTSISNIGGAILRSKTADFERMSTVTPSTAASSAIHTSRRVRNTNGTTSATDAASQPRHTLYKRQELISSAKRTSK